MSAKGYEIYIVIRDNDYPMEAGDPEPWEAGWYKWSGLPGDADVTVHDYEYAQEIAERLSIS